MPWAAGPQAIVIVPTRELAMQVKGELAWLFAGSGARIGCCTGGSDPRAEQAALAAGLDIVVGTPGRLGGHLRLGALRTGHVACVVLDEADQMLGADFRAELEAVLACAAGGPADADVLGHGERRGRADGAAVPARCAAARPRRGARVRAAGGGGGAGGPRGGGGQPPPAARGAGGDRLLRAAGLGGGAGRAAGGARLRGGGAVGRDEPGRAERGAGGAARGAGAGLRGDRPRGAGVRPAGARPRAARRAAGERRDAAAPFRTHRAGGRGRGSRCWW